MTRSHGNAIAIFGAAVVARSFGDDVRALDDDEARALAATMRTHADAGLEAWRDAVVAWAVVGGPDRLLATVRHVARGLVGALADGDGSLDVPRLH